jgi:flavodoxin
MTTDLTRRAFLGSGVAGFVLATGLAGCSTDPGRPAGPTFGGSPVVTPGTGSSRPDSKVLLVYFSRAGENYYDGGRRMLEVGNTEVLATMITARVVCDVYRIEAADPYPVAYTPTVERNTDEQRTDARPRIAEALPGLSGYDVILLGSPVWGVRAPMIMSTFVEGVDLAGKTILPFVTHAVSGMAGIDEAYRRALPQAQVRPGLAVRGQRVADAGPDLDAWMADGGLA